MILSQSKNNLKNIIRNKKIDWIKVIEYLLVAQCYL